MSGSQPDRIGKYEIMSVLGEGGMGVVYQARDTVIDRLVAIKTINTSQELDDQNLVKRLQMEAQSAGRLHHPNIVTVFDFGQEGAIAFLVMEYVEGNNLARMINNNFLIPLDKKLDLLVQISNGLAYAHERGVIHRDMKPSNICVTSEGVAKILDFGLARFDSTRLTKTGFTSGTISYMSPERMRGESGASDDIFALGTVAYELLTYTAAFPGKNYTDVVQKILSSHYPIKPSAVAELPQEIDALVLKAVARDKAARYQTAADFGKAIDQFRHSKAFSQFAEQKTFIRDTPFVWEVEKHTGQTPYSAPEIEQHPEATAELRPAGELATVAMTPGTTPSIGRAPVSQTATSATPAEDATVFKQPTPSAADAAAYAPTVMDSAPALDRNRAMAQQGPAVAGTAPGMRRPAPQAGPTGTVVAPKPDISQTTSMISETISGTISGISGITRTVVARFRKAKRTLSGETPTPELSPPTQMTAAVQAVAPPAVPAINIEEENRKALILGATVGVLTLIAPIVYNLIGLAAFLVAYAGAAYVWTWMIRRRVKPSLLIVIAFALAMRLPMFFISPSDESSMELYLADAAGRLTEVVSVQKAPSTGEAPARKSLDKRAAGKPAAEKTAKADAEPAETVATTPHPPFARLLFLTWSKISDRFFLWRLLLLLADVGLIYLIYAPGFERRALAYAAFPLVVLEGVWDGRVELLAALFLVAALGALRKEHDGRGGILLGIAVGSTFYSLFAIPSALRASMASIGMFIGAFLGFFLPAYYFGLSNAWLGRIAYNEFDSTPMQLVYQTILGVVEDNGMAMGLRARWQSLTASMPGQSLAESIANSITTNSITMALLIALFATITISIAKHSRDFDSGAANGIGTALLLTAAAPWYWLLVIPFAIAANRSVWLLYALFSPIVFLTINSGGAPAWFAWGGFYLIPASIALGLRLQKASGENVSVALDLSAIK